MQRGTECMDASSMSGRCIPSVARTLSAAWKQDARVHWEVASSVIAPSIFSLVITWNSAVTIIKFVEVMGSLTRPPNLSRACAVLFPRWFSLGDRDQYWLTGEMYRGGSDTEFPTASHPTIDADGPDLP